MNNKIKVFIWGAGFFLLLFPFFIKYPIVQFTFTDHTYYLTEDTFQLKWIHSVEKEEWIEVYERDGDQFLLTKTILQTFGAGTPSDGDIIDSDDNRIHMKVNRQISHIDLIISENIRTSVITQHKKIPLYRFAEDYTNINITVTYVYLWEYVGGERLNER